MKKLVLLALILAAPALADGWEGKRVQVRKGALMCSYFYMERALTVMRAGDQDSLRAYVQAGHCAFAPQDFVAIVTTDASEWTNPDLAEITLRGQSIWIPMAHAECCLN